MATAYMSAIDMQNVVDGVALRRMAHIAFIHEGKRGEFPLDAEEHWIGWNDDCDILLPGNRWFATVVASITWVNNRWQVQSESRWRKLRVKDRVVDVYKLVDGDRITVSGIELRFRESV